MCLGQYILLHSPTLQGNRDQLGKNSAAKYRNDMNPSFFENLRIVKQFIGIWVAMVFQEIQMNPMCCLIYTFSAGWIPEKITRIIYNQFYKIVEPNVWCILQAVCSSLTALWHWMSLCSAILHNQHTIQEEKAAYSINSVGCCSVDFMPSHYPIYICCYRLHCKQCDFSCNHEAWLVTHMRQHAKGKTDHRCEFCGYTAPNPHRLKVMDLLSVFLRYFIQSLLFNA